MVEEKFEISRGILSKAPLKHILLGFIRMQSGDKGLCHKHRGNMHVKHKSSRDRSTLIHLEIQPD
jgi:hypothetical protein